MLRRFKVWLGQKKRRHQSTDQATGEPLFMGLRMRTQAWLVAAILVVPSALLGYGFFRLQQANIDFSQKERDGVRYVKATMVLRWPK